jgi:hypothetical protein
MQGANFVELRHYEVRRIPLLGCEYPGEWLWATSWNGLTLLLERFARLLIG